MERAANPKLLALIDQAVASARAMTPVDGYEFGTYTAIPSGLWAQIVLTASEAGEP